VSPLLAGGLDLPTGVGTASRVGDGYIVCFPDVSLL
jgi:hypothetical protein